MRLFASAQLSKEDSVNPPPCGEGRPSEAQAGVGVHYETLSASPPPGMPFASLSTCHPPRKGEGWAACSVHQPNHSGLRGSSTVLTFSSLIVPFAVRSLMSPSVG